QQLYHFTENDLCRMYHVAHYEVLEVQSFRKNVDNLQVLWLQVVCVTHILE
ncbi:hypothetical protein ACJX0J_011731, partial [Zea mays]